MTKAGPPASGAIPLAVALAIQLVMLGITPAFAIDASPAGLPADVSVSANEQPAAAGR